MARRDAMRNRGRSLLVIVMIALPVLALSGADVLARTMQLNTTEKINRTMGRADATFTVAGGVVHQTPSLSVGGWSSDGETVRPGTPAYTAARQRLVRSLPPGTRMIEMVQSSGPAGTPGRRTTDVEVRGVDLRDPLTTGMVRIVRGRAAATTSEVTLTPSLADRLHVNVGEDVTVFDGSYRVVGEVRNPQALGADQVYVLPSALGPSSDAFLTTLLASTPRPITWSDVMRLNRIGVAVDSRYVLQHPPAGVPFADSSTLAARARSIGIATVAVGLAVLEVVLLAGATFAVGARRQRRDLALVAAAGGDERAVRRIVLSGGVVLGAAGAAIGVVLGALAGRLLLPVATRLAQADAGHLDLRALELLAVALVGLGTGVAAAILPARAAARDDVVAALTGRRGVVATARRVPVLGLGMIVLGAAPAAYAAHPPARFTLVLAGAVIAEIGFVVCAPAVVGAAGHLARRLPLTLRLPTRDASRHRNRTGPAVAAVLAAVAGSIAVSAWITSTIEEGRQQYQPTLRIGQTALQIFPDSKNAAPSRADVEAFVTRNLPATGLTALSTAQCYEPNCRTTYVQPVIDTSQCAAGSSCAVSFGTSVLAVGGPDVLDEVLGRHDAAAVDALQRGEVVVLSPVLAAHGRATLETTPNGDGGNVVDHVAAAHVSDVGDGGAAAAAVMSPATATRLHVKYYPWGYLVRTSRVPTVAELDAAQADMHGWAANVVVERGYHPERWNYGLLALAGAAALVTLGATAIAT